MDKLNKTFQDGEVLYAGDLNPLVNKVNELVDFANEGGGGGGDIPAGSVTTDKIADEAVTMDKLSQEVQEAISGGGGEGMGVQTFSGILLQAQADTYYRADAAVDNLTVQLPAMSEAKVRTVILGITTGSAPVLSFTAADGKAIRYVDGYLIKALTSYEINIMYNGLTWTVAYVVIASN